MYYELCTSLLKSISHPTRMEILDILKDTEELCVCEIYERLDLEQSNVSQHLKILRDKGILSSRKDGLKVMYAVKYREIYGIFDVIKGILKRELEESRLHLS